MLTTVILGPLFPWFFSSQSKLISSIAIHSSFTITQLVNIKIGPEVCVDLLVHLKPFSFLPVHYHLLSFFILPKFPASLCIRVS